jgi:hypothetical protein
VGSQGCNGDQGIRWRQRIGAEMRPRSLGMFKTPEETPITPQEKEWGLSYRHGCKPAHLCVGTGVVGLCGEKRGGMSVAEVK